MSGKRMANRAQAYDSRQDKRREKAAYKKLKRENKRKLEFSQRIALTIVAYSGFIVFFTVCLNFVLLWTDKMPMAEETIATISTYGGITATAGTVVYGALAGWRDYSKNKTGVTHGEAQIPGPFDHTGNHSDGGESNG